MSKPLYILATEKSWHNDMFERLSSSTNCEWIRVKSKGELGLSIEEYKPEMIFFPHWSHIIPKSIIELQKCIIFHMTDLPYGRGGSPLQNLIVDGKKETMMTALLANEGLDEGDIFLKTPLSLAGSAQEIFKRAVPIIENMINKIIDDDVQPTPQSGIPTLFKRRTPEMSDIKSLKELNEIYDYIRMLDAEGYPHAYIETNSFKLEFTNAELKDEEVIANVRFIKK